MAKVAGAPVLAVRFTLTFTGTVSAFWMIIWLLVVPLTLAPRRITRGRK